MSGSVAKVIELTASSTTSIEDAVRSGIKPDDKLKKELMDAVVKQIGALARPDQIRFTDSLPKTRSGKIMRRLLKELASGSEVKGDTTTLEDFSVLAKLKSGEE